MTEVDSEVRSYVGQAITPSAVLFGPRTPRNTRTVKSDKLSAMKLVFLNGARNGHAIKARVADNDRIG